MNTVRSELWHARDQTLLTHKGERAGRERYNPPEGRMQKEGKENTMNAHLKDHNPPVGPDPSRPEDSEDEVESNEHKENHNPPVGVTRPNQRQQG